jgi:hypothetical protein
MSLIRFAIVLMPHSNIVLTYIRKAILAVVEFSEAHFFSLRSPLRKS